MPDEPNVQKKGINLIPSEGFSLAVDGKLKTQHSDADTAMKQAIEMKTRFPALQIMVRDNSTGIRTPVEATDADTA